MRLADFSITESTDTEVVRYGKFFEVGNYPDKGFSLTDAEAEAACGEGFVPFSLNIAHLAANQMPPVFRDKMGRVAKLVKQGKDIFAEFRLPKWLDDAMRGDPAAAVSAEWDKATKRAIGCALVAKPRVRDAAILAAFDAMCDTAGEGDKHVDPATFDGRKGQPMFKEFKEKLKELIGMIPDDDQSAPKASFADSPEYATMKAELDAAKAQAEAVAVKFNEQQTAARDAEVAAFVEGAVRDRKITPAARDQFITLGKASFDALKEAVAKMSALPNFPLEARTDDGKAVDDAEVKDLLAKSPLGRSVLKGRSK
jgi:hypothetical protein